jgi:hypothetical protein
MPRYTMPLWIEIDAESNEAAFAYVRENYAVVDDPTNAIKSLDFEIGDEPTEISQD